MQFLLHGDYTTNYSTARVSASLTAKCEDIRYVNQSVNDYFGDLDSRKQLRRSTNRTA